MSGREVRWYVTAMVSGVRGFGASIRRLVWSMNAAHYFVLRLWNMTLAVTHPVMDRA
jgi:hypothetical protein